MRQKICASPEDALDGLLRDGMTLMSGAQDDRLLHRGGTGLTLLELAPEVTLSEVRGATAAPFTLAPHLLETETP